MFGGFFSGGAKPDPNDHKTAFVPKAGDSNGRRLERLYYALLVSRELAQRSHGVTETFSEKEEFILPQEFVELPHLVDNNESYIVGSVFDSVFADYNANPITGLTLDEMKEFMSHDRDAMYAKAVNDVILPGLDAKVPASARPPAVTFSKGGHIVDGTLGDSENAAMYSLTPKTTTVDPILMGFDKINRNMQARAAAKKPASATVNEMLNHVDNFDDDELEALEEKMRNLKMAKQKNKSLT